MSNDIVIPQAPAWALSAQGAANFNTSISAGISIGFPRIAIKAARWRIRQGEDETVLQDFFLDVVLVGANPAISKSYYAKKYTPDSNEPPDCASDDGVTPNLGVPQAQSTHCATCQWNIWGSRISNSGKQAKACQDQKHLAVLAAGALDGDIYALTLPPASLKGLAIYVNTLTSRNILVPAMVTRLTFDETADYPLIKFTPNRWLTEEEFNKAIARTEDPLIKQVCAMMPRAARAVPVQQPVPTPPPVQQPVPTPPPVQQPVPTPPPPPPAAAGAAAMASAFGGAPAAPAAPAAAAQTVTPANVAAAFGGAQTGATVSDTPLREVPAQGEDAVPSGLAKSVMELLAKQGIRTSGA